MSQTPATPVPITAYIVNHLSAGWRSMFRKSSADSVGLTTDAGRDIFASDLPGSEFPEMFACVEEVDPLTEAEVFVLFGRRGDAQAALDAALQDGRLSPEDVARFWGE